MNHFGTHLLNIKYKPLGGHRTTAYKKRGCYNWLEANDLRLKVHNNTRITSMYNKIIPHEWKEYNGSTNTPYFIESDPAFNNHSVLLFDEVACLKQFNGAGFLYSQTSNHTIAMVLSGGNMGYNNGLNYVRNAVLSDGVFTDVRFNGENFNLGTITAGAPTFSMGFCTGCDYSNRLRWNTLLVQPMVVVVSKTNFIVNGESRTTTYSGSFDLNSFSVLGGIGAAYTGVFKLAEVIGWDSYSTVDQCISLSDEINKKYKLY